MKRRIISLMMALLICVPLTGCWNYRGLDTLDIVSGIAFDKDEQSGDYLLTFEIIDTQSSGKDDGTTTKYVESRGETAFDAIRNAKKRLINKLYGGNMQTMIISHQIAETEGVFFILEQLLRDGEARETISVAISQEETAKEILLTKGLDSKIIAYEIHDMIMEDNSVSASTKDLSLYRAYGQIRGAGNALVLPAIHSIDNNGETVVECNGIALFQGDRLIGYDSSQNTRSYLFVVNEIKGGAFSLPMGSPEHFVSLEIKNSSTSSQVSLQDGQVHISIHIKTKFNVTETNGQMEISQINQRQEAEEKISEALRGQIEEYVHMIQDDVKVDIFGFGRQIYQHQPALWQSIEKDWDSYFQNASVKVRVEADILTFGSLKDY